MNKWIVFEKEGDGGGSPPPAIPPAAPPEPTPGADEGDFPTSWKEVFEHKRFKELTTRAQTAEAALSKIQADQKKAADKALADQQKWQELAEQRQAEIDPLKAENLRLRVALKKRLPEEMIDRLRGATAEEMETDADTLLQLLKPSTGPGVPPAPRNSGGNQALDLSKMTPAEIREKTKGKAIADVV